MEISEIERLIYLVRGQRVMLDSDLAAFYGVLTGNLNKAVLRNQRRFPPDFVFRLTEVECDLIFQSGISKKRRGGRRFLPYAFTEHGVAMLSSVLRSDRAVRVNIEIVRAFVRLRRALAVNRDLERRLEGVEKDLESCGAVLGEHAEAIRSVFEDIRGLMGAPAGPRRRIGFRPQ